MCSGEGIELAFNSGAELFNLEFVTMWIMPTKFRWEGVTFLLPMGAVFVNEQGESFMERYSPVFKSNCDYNYIARAMAMEAKQGKFPFYLDCSGMRPEDKELMTPAEGWTELMYKQLLKAGIRPFEERLAVRLLRTRLDASNLEKGSPAASGRREVVFGRCGR